MNGKEVPPDNFSDKKSEKKSKSNSDIKNMIALSSLHLAAQDGWDNVSLQDIASHAHISMGDLYEYIDQKSDILALIGRLIDKRLLAGRDGSGKSCDDACKRDQVFDILMDRYEILNEYKDGMLSIFGTFKCDPKQAVISMPHICKSMSWVLESAGVNTSGIQGSLKVFGLTVIYIRVLRVWMYDDSADLAKTMAALDKALEHGESLSNSFGL